MPVRRGSTILNSDVRTEAVSMSQTGGPNPTGKLWGHSESTTPDSGSLPPRLSPGAGAPPYLGGPVAMNQDWEGVVGQVPRSHLAHFKLEHDLICGSENRDLSSIRPRGQVLGSDPDSLHIRQQVGLLCLTVIKCRRAFSQRPGRCPARRPFVVSDHVRGAPLCKPLTHPRSGLDPAS